jgi:prepilin-type N-terminal cleavage/methylation domain-containing protein
MDKKGFTLMEVMITVAIVGIIAAIAIPSYRSYMQRGRMAAAYADIQIISLLEEKAFAQDGQYRDYAYLESSYGLKIEEDQKYYDLDINLSSNTSTNDRFVIYAEPNNNYISKRPCMRSDGLQGYSTAANPSWNDCAVEEWTGR